MKCSTWSSSGGSSRPPSTQQVSHLVFHIIIAVLYWFVSVFIAGEEMFTGHVSGKRINLGGASRSSGDKASFMEETRRVREQRELAKRKEIAAVAIQRHVRGHLARQRSKSSLIALLEHRVAEIAKSVYALPAQVLRKAVLTQLLEDTKGRSNIASIAVLVNRVQAGDSVSVESLSLLAQWILAVSEGVTPLSPSMRARLRAIFLLSLRQGVTDQTVRSLLQRLVSDESVTVSPLVPKEPALGVTLFRKLDEDSAALVFLGLLRETAEESSILHCFLCFLQATGNPILPSEIAVQIPTLTAADLDKFDANSVSLHLLGLVVSFAGEAAAVGNLVPSLGIALSRASEPVIELAEQSIVRALLQAPRSPALHSLLNAVRLDSITEELAFKLATQTRIVEAIAQDLLGLLTLPNEQQAVTVHLPHLNLPDNHQSPTVHRLVMEFTILYSRVVGGISSGYTSVLSTPTMEQLFPLLNRLAFEWLSHYIEVDERIFNLIRAVYDKKHIYPGLKSDAVWTVPESVALVPPSAYSYDLRDTVDDMTGDKSHSELSISVFDSIMENMPHVLPFQRRLGFFASVRTSRQSWSLFRSPLAERLRRVRREFLLEDGLEVIAGSSRDMLRIEFVGRDGSVESGIDGGGLFKEFMQQWTVAVMDPAFGLFRQLPNGRLTPSASAYTVHGENTDRLFRAAGKAVGKALYEMVLLETHLGEAFLSRVLGKSFTLEQLKEIDETLFRNLKFVSECKNVEDLELTFSVSLGGELGTAVVEHELVPGGSGIAVTNANRLRYVLLASWFHLARQLDRPAAAFAAGVSEIVPLSRLRIFSPTEINLLVSGEQRKGFDVQDLVQNVVFGGGYTETSQTVELLFEVLRECSDDDRSAFLAFVTSSPRPPLLGFKVMHPKFGINRVPERDRLPTAATCTNLLKLPDYRDKRLLREKLLVAIHAQSGFDLS